MPNSYFQQDALLCKAPFINLLLSSSCGKQKAQEEMVDRPAGGAEGKVRVIKAHTFFPSVINTLLHRHKNLPCHCLCVYCMCKQLYT